MNRKLIVACLLAAGTATLAASPADAAWVYRGPRGAVVAHWGPYRGWDPYYWHRWYGGAVAAGVAVGTAAAVAAYRPAVVYVPPVYPMPPVVYGP